MAIRSLRLMATDYQGFAQQVREFDRAIAAIGPSAAALGIPPPAGQEWFDLLRNKLLAQIDLPPLLVVAIVGGTNIGKSVIFNLVAGEVASASSPLAAGTKHPVCLAPKELANPALLERLFESFALHAWRSADDPLADSPENRLFWRQSNTIPPRLLLLDAPDVDSDATVNWGRARAIRQAADVLVAVLTQQKYNDAAVKQFFRAAVEADKPIIVLFNQCELVFDAEFWPLWLETFCQETGARPELVYVVPHDRAAADALRLPFYSIGGQGSGASGQGPGLRPGESGPRPTAGREDKVRDNSPRPLAGEGPGVRAGETRPRPTAGREDKVRDSSPRPLAGEGPGVRAGGSPFAERHPANPESPIPNPSLVPASLRDDLAALHFDAIKVRTFRGAIRRVLDRQKGLPGYLDSIRRAAGEFAAANAALSTTELARIGWPSLPTGLLVDEIRDWWDSSRQAWSRHVHGFYRTLGRGVTWPLRTAWGSLTGPPTDPVALFQQQERTAVVAAVEKLLDELERLAEVGNEVLRPRLAQLLGGRARATLLDRVQAAHETLPAIDEHYRVFLRAELDGWRSSNPRAVRFLQSLDHAAALARPAITVALFFTGLHFAGDLVGQAAAQAAGATAGHLAAEAAIAGGITGGGEALVSTTSEGVRQAAGRLFIRLQARYAQQRATWLAEWLERELLGDLLGQLRGGAETPQQPAFRKIESLLGAVRGAR